jgi:hypothetical protein
MFARFFRNKNDSFPFKESRGILSLKFLSRLFSSSRHMASSERTLLYLKEVEEAADLVLTTKQGSIF